MELLKGENGKFDSKRKWKGQKIFSFLNLNDNNISGERKMSTERAKKAKGLNDVSEFRVHQTQTMWKKILLF